MRTKFSPQKQKSATANVKLNRALTATENAGNEIRVNAMCPSWVNTPMMDRDIAKVPQLSEIVKKTVPLGRMASVDEVTDSILYLCSPGSSYVTGVGFLVDGGTLAAVNLG